ncbi:MAG: hypothetical protein MPW14_14085 [Candidatus Manganitrophus sp.]|nr:hypothetical protein [Candidatus Manganitrophus sp.]MDC4223610.1 hypothetical protein [Candidatus Manganitrophus sp.]WDT70016.1 MAG: hypothetical protein MPW17_14750 [Candidatus Manganitrophus sp.]WDT78339.1 MAG: hypothetical protein MPW14_14085 [Candidatus Manganitrophus sp.]
MRLQIVVLVFIFLFGPLQSAWSEASPPAGGDKGLLLQQIAGDDPEVQAAVLKELAEGGIRRFFPSSRRCTRGASIDG